MSVEAIQEALEAHEDVYPGQFWLSVNARAGLSVRQIAEVARRPNPKLRQTTVGAIEDAGWSIVPTPRRRDGHCDVFYGDGAEMPPLEAIQRLSMIFGPAQDNPGRRR